MTTPVPNCLRPRKTLLTTPFRGNFLWSHIGPNTPESRVSVTALRRVDLASALTYGAASQNGKEKAYSPLRIVVSRLARGTLARFGGVADAVPGRTSSVGRPGFADHSRKRLPHSGVIVAVFLLRAR